MDTHAFASLAHVRILLVPVGTLSRAAFDRYATEIRSYDCLRLVDIPLDATDERARFLPNPLSTGYIHLSFLSHHPPHSHTPLSLLRPSHFPLAVLGITSCTHPVELQAIDREFIKVVHDLFPKDSIFPLAKRCFVYEGGDTTVDGSNFPNLAIMPGAMANKKLHIGTLLASLCSCILGEFGVLIQFLEGPLGNEYLNSSMLPVLPPLSEISSSLYHHGKKDSLPTIPSYNSQPEISRSNISAVPMTRNASFGPSIRQSTLIARQPRKRVSTIGVASSHGRLFKVLGDFFLLSGRTEDAGVWYSEALQLLRSSTDHIWHASALEGLATISILEAWSAGHGLQNSVASGKEPWADVCDKLVQATGLYFKSPMSDMEQMNSLTALLYCTCVLRHTSVLFSVWSAKGWGPMALTTMMQPGPKPYLPPTLFPDETDYWLKLERLSILSGISRSSISSIITQIHGPWLLHLASRERIALLEATACVFGCLGYKRKEAFVLREVLGCIMDLMVCGRPDDSSHTISPTALSIDKTNQSTTGIDLGTVGVRINESTYGNDSILNVLKHVCKILGINLESVRVIDLEPDALPLVEDDKTSIIDYDAEMVEEHRKSFGWPELQVGVVREAVAVAEALPDFIAVAQFALSSLKTLRSILSAGDQYHLYTTSTRALMTARRRGRNVHAEYWSGRPVLSIRMTPLPAILHPVEKRRSILSTEATEISLLRSGIDPFLYNPRRAAGKEKTLVVQNEIIEFTVNLENRYFFDIELMSLSLSTSGVDFETSAIRVSMPANSFLEVALSGKPLRPGILTIRGCFAQIPGGVKREYVLPLFSAEEEERVSRKKSVLACERDRLKYWGLDSYSVAKEFTRKSAQKRQSDFDSFRYLECQVVPKQPLLRIRRTSLTHGAIMLYEGERSTIRIVLENVSTVPVDFLRLSFMDSTIASAEESLAGGNLSVFEVHDTEFDLTRRPFFSWSKEESRVVAPGDNITLSISSFGKIGCTHGTIYVSYSHVGETAAGSADVFHTRQLSYPVTVTVYHMLDCHGMNIISFPSYPSPSNGKSQFQKEETRGDLYVDGQPGWCLFYVDVRNIFGHSFDVTLDRIHKGVPAATTTVTIPPGSMSRLVLPIMKVALSEEETSKPLPTLTDKQFVVDRSDLSEQEFRSQLQLFWYREALLAQVRGRWRETGGIRQGQLSLRHLSMTPVMCQAFQLEAAYVELTLISTPEADVNDASVRYFNGRYYPEASTFLYLRVQVTNLTDSPLVYTMDLELEPAACITYERVLSDIPVGRLQSRESQTTITGLCFLANGRYDISASVYASDSPQTGLKRATGGLVAVVDSDGDGLA